MKLTNAYTLLSVFYLISTIPITGHATGTSTMAYSNGKTANTAKNQRVKEAEKAKEDYDNAAPEEKEDKKAALDKALENVKEMNSAQKASDAMAAREAQKGTSGNEGSTNSSTTPRSQAPEASASPQSNPSIEKAPETQGPKDIAPSSTDVAKQESQLPGLDKMPSDQIADPNAIPKQAMDSLPQEMGPANRNSASPSMDSANAGPSSPERAASSEPQTNGSASDSAKAATPAKDMMDHTAGRALAMKEGVPLDQVGNAIDEVNRQAAEQGLQPLDAQAMKDGMDYLSQNPGDAQALQNGMEEYAKSGGEFNADGTPKDQYAPGSPEYNYNRFVYRYSLMKYGL